MIGRSLKLDVALPPFWDKNCSFALWDDWDEGREVIFLSPPSRAENFNNPAAPRKSLNSEISGFWGAQVLSSGERWRH
jgi:hypothetical protein